MLCKARLVKELNKLMISDDNLIKVVKDFNNDESQITIKEPENLMEWNIKIRGPDNSPYEKNIFDIVININENYPIKPPSVKFISPIYHPNIYKDGKICIDILQPHEWTPVLNIKSVIISIISLLCDPNPHSPANREAADLYKNDIEAYNKKVKLSINL